MLKQLSLAILAVAVATSASAGGLTVKVGAGYLDPTGKKDIGSLYTNAQVSGEAAILPSIDYRFGNTPFSAELLLATPFEHNLTGTDVGGNKVQVASFKQLPPTLTFKYNTPELLPGLTANVGVGATVLIPYEEQFTAIALSDKKLEAKTTVAPAAQIGVNYHLPNKPWGVFADVRYADLSTNIKADGTKVGELEVNPVVYSIGISHKF